MTTQQRPRILVVDDEPLIAMVAEDQLNELGFDVAGPYGEFEAALKAAQSEDFVAALLDIEINGRKVFPIADALAARGLPFAFISGHARPDIPAPHSERPTLSKPYAHEDLKRILARLV